MCFEVSAEKGAPVRRWLGRALEAVAIKMLALARRLNPHEVHAFDSEPESASLPQADDDTPEKPRPIAQTT